MKFYVVKRVGGRFIKNPLFQSKYYNLKQYLTEDKRKANRYLDFHFAIQDGKKLFEYWPFDILCYEDDKLIEITCIWNV